MLTIAFPEEEKTRRGFSFFLIYQRTYNLASSIALWEFLTSRPPSQSERTSRRSGFSSIDVIGDVSHENKITQGQEKKSARIEGSKGQVKGLSP